MLFNSLHFLVFFPIVVAVYFVVSPKYRWIFLLTASYYFYMAWKIEYVFLILASTLIAYVSAILISGTANTRQRKLYLILSLLSNLGILFAFKYFNFFNDSVRILLNSFNIFYEAAYFKLLLPVGISFYTFQSVSYTIDVYRGKCEPEKHFGIFALYLSFFPQLVAGPIERASSLIPQFYKKLDFDETRVVSGLRLILWGFFQKVVVADNAAKVVNHVYNNPDGVSSLALIIATVFFAFQIYGDFSGYTDIARGAARILGFELTKNFDRPYAARSIADFWRRWHTSLMSWFKDYVYIPLGGSRVRRSRWLANTIIVFLISGLWHGAGLTFVVWGLLNAIYILCSKFTQEFRETFVRLIGLASLPKLHNFVRVLSTFILVNIAWIFFRAKTVSDAFYIVKNIVVNFASEIVNVSNIDFIRTVFYQLGADKKVLLTAVCAIVILEIAQFKNNNRQFLDWFERQPRTIRWLFYYALIFIIIFFGDYGQQAFIYFQF